MRRVIGLTLAGLGAFLLVAALMLRTYVGGQLIKFPINEYVKTTLLAKNASYFSPALVRPVTGATIQVTDTVKGDAKASSSSTAVWNEFTYLYDLTNHQEYAVSTRRAAFNRRTSQLVDCCGASVNGNSTIRQTGVSGYVFPLGVQKRTYDVFDTNVNRPMPFHYEGTGTIDGIGVYRFVEHVTSVRAGSEKVPGSLVGLKQLIDLVDPAAGVLHGDQYLLDRSAHRRPAGHHPEPDAGPPGRHGPAPVAAAGRRPDHDAAERAHRGEPRLDGTERTALVPGLHPADSGAELGLALLVGGIVLALMRRHEEIDESAPEPVLGPAR